jgi:hypothetical protein
MVIGKTIEKYKTRHIAYIEEKNSSITDGNNGEIQQ